MRVEDVVDRETLKAYLDGVPNEKIHGVARTIASRCAARVLPIAVRHFQKEEPDYSTELTALHIFRCSIVAQIAAFFPVGELGKEASDSYSASSEYARAVQLSAASAAYAAVDSAVDHFPSSGPITYAAARAADYAGRAGFVWDSVRQDLRDLSKGGTLIETPLWVNGVAPKNLSDAGIDPSDPVDWSFWIEWFERTLQGRELKYFKLKEVVTSLSDEDWEKGPEHINPMFDEVLALYRAEDEAAGSGKASNQQSPNVPAIRSQVSTLREYLEIEYLRLYGHNARNPEEDELLELLRDLKTLVEQMFDRLEGTLEDSAALTVVTENLPAVIEKAGELALVQPEPEISENVIAMAAITKKLTESGADPKMATQIAMSEVARQRLWPRVQQMFAWVKAK